MSFRNWNNPWVIIGLLVVVATTLGGCTRERSPWPTGTPNPLIVKLGPASSPTRATTPSAAALTAQQATLEPGEAFVNATPFSQRGLPPLPGNETLTPEPPTPTPEPTFILYKVKPGDSLYTIAVGFDITVEDIKQHNQLDHPNTLRVGQELKIPQQPNATETAGQAGQAAEEGYIHVVQPGETLFGIAQRYSVPLNELAKANNITNPGALRVGQRLRIPDAAAPKPTNTGQRVHIVQPGETLSEIAIQYGVTPKAIAKANSLSNPSRIVSGQKLIIP
jgi:LysM repeat protein